LVVGGGREGGGQKAWWDCWKIGVGRREWPGSAGGFELKRVKELEVGRGVGGLGAGSRRAERRRMGVLGKGTWSGKWLVGRRNKRRAGKSEGGAGRVGGWKSEAGVSM
jgi:hypothetical protein